VAPLAALEAVEAGLDELVGGLAGAGVRGLTHGQLTDVVARARRAQARLEAVVVAAPPRQLCPDAEGNHYPSVAAEDRPVSKASPARASRLAP
jgi:hypothetical protein